MAFLCMHNIFGLYLTNSNQDKTIPYEYIKKPLD